MSKVYLNVYDLNANNQALRPLGLGFYHSGIEVHGVEYTFGQEGLGIHEPKIVNGATFRDSIYLGETKLTKEQLEYLCKELGKEGFSGKDYHYTKNNCNHFTKALCSLIFKEENVDNKIPKWINRLSWWGAKLPFLVSPSTPQSPVQTSPTANSGSPIANSPTSSPGHLSPSTKSFTAFSGSGKSLNKSSSLKSVFSRTSSKPSSPVVDREQILKATQARFEQQQ
jgi:hypothetical protein